MGDNGSEGMRPYVTVYTIMPEQVRFSDIPPSNATGEGELPTDFFEPPIPTEDYSADGIPVYHTAKGEVIEDEHGEQALLSLIPLLSGSPLKAKYLSYRATGFSVMEACKLAGVAHKTVMTWRYKDEEFRSIEVEQLPMLQSRVRSQVLLLNMARIVHLAFHIDGKIFLKAAHDLESLNGRELELFKLNRKHYTPESLLTLERALAPETDAITRAVPGTVTVIVDNRVVETEAAQRAANRKLLEDFRVNKQMVEVVDDGDGD